jgi:hypothetical protein
MMAGAAYAWSLQQNESLDLKQALSLYAFLDDTMVTGSIFYELGNAYKKMGIELDNSSALFELLQRPIQYIQNTVNIADYSTVINQSREYLDSIAGLMPKFESSRQDNDLLKRELALTVDLLFHACLRGQLAINPLNISKTILLTDIQRILSEYKSVWLQRNREGGLAESLMFFNTALNDYL